jgi:DNA-directed RNA polymerase specialized sigma24 family protein
MEARIGQMAGAGWWPRRLSAVRADQPQTDEVVLSRVAAGDPDALAELYHRHGGPILGYLIQLARDRMTAEEILQDTLLAVWRSADSFAGRSGVRTWLIGVARRQAHNRLRLTPPPLAVDLPERADTQHGPEEVTIAAVGGTHVAAAVARLPAEIGALLSIPVGTVKSRLHHARAALARMLADAEVSE